MTQEVFRELEAMEAYERKVMEQTYKRYGIEPKGMTKDDWIDQCERLMNENLRLKSCIKRMKHLKSKGS